MNARANALLGMAGLLAVSTASQAALESRTEVFTDASGMSAQVTFEFDPMVDDQKLTLRIVNTSTDTPDGFDSSDQLLTGVSWNFGDGTLITGGSAMLGAGAVTVNFDNVVSQLSAGDDVGAEWGFGNSTQSGLLFNHVSGNTSGTDPFGAGNLDGSPNLNGPQAGLIPASGELVGLGGLGAIKGELVIMLNLDKPLANLDFASLVRVEYGSDALFIENPAPGSVSLIAIGGLVAARRRRN